AAGRFQGGTVTVTGIPAGGNIEYIMLGWTGGTTLDLAIASGGMIGQSALVTGIATGNPTSIPAGTPTLMNASFGGMTLGPLVTGPVPEPSTFALAGLGAAALLIFRRRK
ncbi:MAG: PEP-CTERM sorting domain-containing protein, partial [Verrucomicrobia bacterium]|nr:PEP-CTERM sorting domain-containing protein [Verrucomicrobiota bacterium]